MPHGANTHHVAAPPLHFQSLSGDESNTEEQTHTDYTTNFGAVWHLQLCPLTGPTTISTLDLT